MNFDDLVSELAVSHAALVERNLIGAVEELEGRVPTNREVLEHAAKILHPDGTIVYTWKHRPIVVIERDSMKCEDGKMRFEIKSVWREPHLP